MFATPPLGSPHSPCVLASPLEVSSAINTHPKAGQVPPKLTNTCMVPHIQHCLEWVAWATKQHVQEIGGKSKHTTKTETQPTAVITKKKQWPDINKTTNRVLTLITVFRIIQYQEKRQKTISNSTDPHRSKSFCITEAPWPWPCVCWIQ